ncbi:hypothetical protein LINPERHAP2_LOCUS13321 [Linum perenne]
MSNRRKIVVASYRVKGEQVLRVSECCAEKKVFFVDIPSESGLGGWTAFLRLAQGVIGENGVVEVSSLDRSFAEVVGRKGLPDGERCTVVKDHGKVSVLVEEEGTRDRQRYLERCLVFQFVGAGKVRWSDFRGWAARNWGVPVAAEIHSLGDELWMLECSSSMEVGRIVALNRR